MGIELLIGILFVVVLIIVNVIRAQEPPKPPPRRPVRRPPPAPERAGGGAPPVRRPQPASDIDRFLQEIDRIRQGEKEREESPEPILTVPPPARERPASPPPPRPVRPVRPAPPPVAPRPQPPRAAPPPPPPPRPRREPVRSREEPIEIEVVEESARIDPSSPIWRQSLFGRGPAGAHQPDPGAREPTTSVSGLRRAESDLADRLRELLQSDNALPLAVLLREILGEPRARRPII